MKNQYNGDGKAERIHAMWEKKTAACLERARRVSEEQRMAREAK
jgi:hypothetical protein